MLVAVLVCCCIGMELEVTRLDMSVRGVVQAVSVKVPVGEKGGGTLSSKLWSWHHLDLSILQFALVHMISIRNASVNSIY